jgi:methionyl-tRNA formyltransferase
MKKIIDIKKTPKKHVTIKGDGSESHIEIHKEKQPETSAASKDAPENKDISREITPEKADDTHLNETKFPTQKTDPENTTTETQPKQKGLKNDITAPLQTVFMGTGPFAGAILQNVINDDTYTVTTIITQPDKKIGRKKSGISRSLAPNPVRDIAIERNIAIFQPNKLDDAAIDHVTSLKPHIIVVASYGKILPKKFLSIPDHGCINVHASLLPQLRGASPIQNALLLGLDKTGVTIMQMDEGLDTGDIIAQKEVPILEHEKADELLTKLSQTGAELFCESIPKLISKEVTPQPQDSEYATVCQMIDREDGHIQWTETTMEIYNRYRALYPWPGIFSYWEASENQMMPIKLRGIYPFTATLTEEQKALMPGTVFIAQDQLCIKTFDTAIIIEAIQPECKAVMPVYDFLNGHNTFKGAVLR